MKTDIVTTEEIEPPSTMTVPHSRSLVFYKRFFPELSRAEWNDWRWQLRNLITDLYELECILRVSEDERNAIIRHGTCFPIAITPYYASLLDPNDPSQPLRRTIDKDYKGEELLHSIQEEVEVSGVARENENKKIIAFQDYILRKA